MGVFVVIPCLVLNILEKKEQDILKPNTYLCSFAVLDVDLANCYTAPG